MKRLILNIGLVRFAVVFGIVVALAALGAILGGSTSAQTAERERQVSPAPGSTPPPRIVIEDDEVIKIDTELVNLNVRVVDRLNRPINNLSQQEFTIFEDGVQQKIEFFSQSEVPTNYALVIDNSGSLRQQINEVIEASKIIIGTNRPDDETSVIRFVSSDKIEIVQDFTDDRSYLNDALENLYIEGGRTAIIDAVYLAIERVNEYEKDDLGRKRRALVLVSDGEDVNSFYSQRQLFELLKESDVQIFTVGFIRDLNDAGGFFSKSAQSKARSFLESMASETGGKAYFPATVAELPGIARDIANEMRMQYSIGYIPTNDAADGTFRNIRVAVNDGPNREKRIAVTRAGRTAERSGPNPTLQRQNDR